MDELLWVTRCRGRMGAGWRRVQEGLKQKWNVSAEKGFVATSNARNEMMFLEAATFAVLLRKIQAHVKRMQKDTHAMISDTRNIMLCSLPRTFDFTSGGQAVPEDPDPKLIGQNVQLDRFASAEAVLQQRLDEEVVEPLDAWLSAFHDVQGHMRRLEALRLELDSRRRTVDNLQAAVEKQKAAMEEKGEKLQERHEATLRTMHHKENKKNAILAAFQQMETNTFQALYTLLRDTTVLKDYTAVAYSILQEVFGTAFTAFKLGGAQMSGFPSYVQQAQGTHQWREATQSTPTSHKSNSPKGFFRTLSGAFRRGRPDPSTPGEGHQDGSAGASGAYNSPSTGFGEDTGGRVGCFNAGR